MQQAAPMPPRRAADLLRGLGVAMLVVTPLVVAFFSGGYFDEPRLWALLAAAVALAVTAVSARPYALPRSRAGMLAVAGLAGLAAWTGASIAWAPLRGPAFHDFQRLLLYAISFASGVALLRGRSAVRVLEPTLAAGCLIVIGYGMAGRLLPGIVHESHGFAAGGRLDQPLTYWNAVGAVAAFGLVLCARVSGDGSRPRTLRIGAAAGCPLLGMGLYLTYSRGALAAAVAGLLVLAAVAPDRRQLRALVLAVVAAGLGIAIAAPFPTVASLAAGARGRDGAIVLALLVVVAAAAGFTANRFAIREIAGRLAIGVLRIPRLRTLAATGAVTALVVLVVAAALTEGSHASRNPATGATATRLTSLESHRYAYWKVALGAFADHPLDGLGSGGFQVRWLRKRTFPEAVRDAHSLYLETAAELGLVGLAALGLLAAGIVLAARTQLRRDAAAVAGLLAALVAFAGQAGVDWLWEMPTVSLMALLAAAALVAQSEGARGSQPA